jgi:hypothetical protein
MGRSTMIRSLGALALAAFTGLQFWPNTNRSNPAVPAGRAVEARLNIPPACRICSIAPAGIATLIELNGLGILMSRRSPGR